MIISPPKTVLIVEKNAALARRFQTPLAARGYEIRGPAETLESARTEVTTQPPDVILFDLELPGSGDGLAASQHIRAGKNIPVIFLAAPPLVVSCENRDTVCPSGILTKPVLEEELLRTLDSVLGKHRAERELKEKQEALKESEEEFMLLTNLLSLLNQPREMRETLREIVLLIKQQMRLDAVGIRLREGRDFPFFYTRGFNEEFVEAEKSLCTLDSRGRLLKDDSDNVSLECLCGCVLQGKTDASWPFFTPAGSFWSSDTGTLVAGIIPEALIHSLKFRGKCLEEGYQSLALIPLRSSDEIIGLLHLADPRKNLFTPKKIRFFEMIGQTIGIALAREQGKKSLQENRSRLEMTLKGVHAFIYEFPARNKNPKIFGGYREMLGYEAEDAIPRWENWRKQIHPEDRKKIRSYFRRVSAGKDLDAGYELEYRLKEKNNHWLWVRDQGQILAWSREGKPLSSRGVVTDIQKSKDAEKLLQASEATYQTLFNAMSSAIALYDLDKFHLIDANRAFFDLFGGSIREIKKTPRKKAFSEEDFISEEEYQKILGQILDGQNVCLETKDTRKNGEIFWAEKHFSKVNLNGIDRLMVVTSNITELKMMRETMIRTEKMMSLGGLAAGMAHEINNPLSIIMQGAQNILRRIGENLPANLKTAEECRLRFEGLAEYFEKRNIFGSLEAILEAAGRASNIVSNMLDFSCQELPEMEEKNINVILDRAIALAQTDYDLKKKFDFRSIEMQKDFSDLPPVPCVEAEIEQVFLNMLRNSAQSLHLAARKKPVIKIRTRPAFGGVRIEIEDNGMGITPGICERIFEPFFTTRESGVGAGLGLSVSYYIIVHRHQGRIQVSSEAGQWARFSIEIPRRSDAAGRALKNS